MSDEPTREVYLKRLSKIDKINQDAELQDAELEMCRRNVLHFINEWGTTFDPRVKPKHFPFTLYDFQREAIEWIEERYRNKENGLIEKSRDMGATWMVAGWAVHKWIFEPGFSCLMGSRKQDLVDNNQLDSIFGKLRYIIYRLPKFLRPSISTSSRTDKYLALTNPENGNEIKGESANVGFGRGGRSSICFLDEFAHVPHSEAVWASISDNSDCIICPSTPLGKNNQFAWLRFETEIPTLSLHWSKHPKKDKDWYEAKKATMKPHQVAQELDLSYEKSVQGKVYKRFERRWHISPDIIECNQDYEQFICWDFGIADPTAILWGQITVDGRIQIWQCFELSNQDIDFHIPIARGMRPEGFMMLDEAQRKYLSQILKKVPIRLEADHYGDHAGTARTSNSKRSCKAAMREAGINLKSSGKQNFDWRISCLDNLLKLRYNNTRDEWYSIFEVSPDCVRLIDCINNYEYEGDPDKLSDDTIKPKHNWASHMVSALEFFAINRFPLRETSKFREEQVR